MLNNLKGMRNGKIVPYFEIHPDNPYHCPEEPYGAPMWRWGTTASNAIQASASDADLDSLSAHAGDYNKPVLFLASECNTWIGPELQAKHAALYPNSELTVISKAGHDMFWDNPEDIEEILAIRGEPLLARIYRWEKAMPQYTLGHEELLTGIEEGLSKLPGLFLTGSAYRGIGISDCVHEAKLTAEKILQSL